MNWQSGAGTVEPSCAPLITIAVPSFNQGRYLEQTLSSIFAQALPVEVFVVDGGSTDGSVEIIKRWQHRLAGWYSGLDGGQSAAINAGIARGRAPYVCWLNSDDWLLPDGLSRLLEALRARPELPAVYGRAWNVVERTGARSPVWVQAFSERRLALRCIIAQPATLIRRSAWERVGGVDESLHLAMDYDLWWRLYRSAGALQMIDDFVAVNRVHADTKTRTRRREHNREAMAVVRRHHGRVPLKWWIAQPWSVWYKSLFG